VRGSYVAVIGSGDATNEIAAIAEAIGASLAAQNVALTPGIVAADGADQAVEMVLRLINEKKAES